MKFSSFLCGALFAASALLSSCNQQPAAETPAAAAATTTDSTTTTAVPPAAGAVATPAEAAVYECPMGCEGSRSTAPGKCPVCEMDLEKKS